MLAQFRHRAAPAFELLSRRFTGQPSARHRGGITRVAGLTGKNQPAITKRFAEHPSRRLRTWDGMAIAAKKMRVCTPFGDDGWAECRCGFRAKDAGKFCAGMGFGRALAGAR